MRKHQLYVTIFPPLTTGSFQKSACAKITGKEATYALLNMAESFEEDFLKLHKFQPNGKGAK